MFAESPEVAEVDALAPLAPVRMRRPFTEFRFVAARNAMKPDRRAAVIEAWLACLSMRQVVETGLAKTMTISTTLDRVGAGCVILLADVPLPQLDNQTIARVCQYDRKLPAAQWARMWLLVGQRAFCTVEAGCTFALHHGYADRPWTVRELIDTAWDMDRGLMSLRSPPQPIVYATVTQTPEHRQAIADAVRAEASARLAIRHEEDRKLAECAGALGLCARAAAEKLGRPVSTIKRVCERHGVTLPKPARLARPVRKPEPVIPPPPPLTAEEQIALVLRFKNGDRRAADRLIGDFERMFLWTRMRRLPVAADVVDRVQAARVALPAILLSYESGTVRALVEAKIDQAVKAELAGERDLFTCSLNTPSVPGEADSDERIAVLPSDEALPDALAEAAEEDDAEPRTRVSVERFLARSQPVHVKYAPQWTSLYVSGDQEEIRPLSPAQESALAIEARSDRDSAAELFNRLLSVVRSRVGALAHHAAATGSREKQLADAQAGLWRAIRNYTGVGTFRAYAIDTIDAAIRAGFATKKIRSAVDGHTLYSNVDDPGLSDVLAWGHRSPLSALAAREQVEGHQATLDHLCSTLSPREHEIVGLLYLHESPETIDELAETRGDDPDELRRIAATALRKVLETARRGAMKRVVRTKTSPHEILLATRVLLAAGMTKTEIVQRLGQARSASADACASS